MLVDKTCPFSGLARTPWAPYVHQAPVDTMGHPEQETARPLDGSDTQSLDVESGPNDSRENLIVKPLRSWKGYVWDTWELPSDQRKLLFKVDAFVLTFASIGYFLKNLDQSNVNNAFLSGMEEDLQMFGNQLVTST